MEASAEFSQPTRPEKILKSPGNPKDWSQSDPAPVSLISREKKSGDAGEKISLDEPGCQDSDDVSFIKTAPVMELRRRYAAEANAHRNMLARRKSGRTVNPDFKEFRSFLLHVRPMPGTGMTLDRIDNNDPEYAPGKVRWADRRTQNNNKSDTLTFYYSRTGETYTTSRLAKFQNVSTGAIRKRRLQGWSDDEIVEGQRSASPPKPKSALGNTVGPALTSKFPVGLYTPRQLALLSQSEAQLSSADVLFHRNAHYHQWCRDNEGEEAMLPTYEELHDFLEEHAAGLTREKFKLGFLKHWKDFRPHVVYGDLKPYQKAMLAEYDPEWTATQEAREEAAQGLKELF